MAAGAGMQRFQKQGVAPNVDPTPLTFGSLMSTHSSATFRNGAWKQE